MRAQTAPDPKQPGNPGKAAQWEKGDQHGKQDLQEQATLQGTWSRTFLTIDGEEKNENQGEKQLVFKESQVTIRWERKPNPKIDGDPGNKVDQNVLTFTLDPSKRPKEITISGVNGQAPTLLGIYKLGNDTLTIATFGKSEVKRPKAFSPKEAGDDEMLLIVEMYRKEILPVGGVPLIRSRAVITADALNKVTKRLESTPAEELDKWVVELERITDKKLEGELAEKACRTDFVSWMSVAYDDLKWNAKTADKLFKRAQTMPASEAKAWKETFEAVLKKDIGPTATKHYAGGPAYAVPLVLIPVDALHEGEKYSAERGKKYLARLKQLTAEDVSLWKDKVDQFGGTELDAALNIILLDDYFDKEEFQREKFKAAIGARKK
jgi:uncharacterized protein (TIGR03067 family)